MKTVYMWVDGACIPNPGKTGYGVLLMNEDKSVSKQFSGSRGIGTNNAAEIIAVIEGLKKLKEACIVHLYSDSQYMLNCAKGEWTRNSNTALWMEFDAIAEKHTIHYYWVRGHSGIPENELVNRLAESAAL